MAGGALSDLCRSLPTQPIHDPANHWELQRGGCFRGKAWVSSQSGSQASSAFLFQIFLSLRRIILGIPTRQVASPQKLCLVVCSGAGPKAGMCQDRPPEQEQRVRLEGECCSHRDAHRDMGAQEVCSPFLSFLWAVIFRASASPSNSCFRASANHPDELRMKDLFLL